MTKVKNKAVKYNKNAEALLTFGLPFSYNHRRRPERRKNNHLPPGGFPEAERRKEEIDEADMELISSDSFSEYKNAVCQRPCQKTPGYGSPYGRYPSGDSHYLCRRELSGDGKRRYGGLC